MGKHHPHLVTERTPFRALVNHVLLNDQATPLQVSSKNIGTHKNYFSATRHEHNSNPIHNMKLLLHLKHPSQASRACVSPHRAGQVPFRTPFRKSCILAIRARLCAEQHHAGWPTAAVLFP